MISIAVIIINNNNTCDDKCLAAAPKVEGESRKPSGQGIRPGPCFRTYRTPRDGGGGRLDCSNPKIAQWELLWTRSASREFFYFFRRSSRLVPKMIIFVIFETNLARKNNPSKRQSSFFPSQGTLAGGCSAASKSYQPVDPPTGSKSWVRPRPTKVGTPPPNWDCGCSFSDHFGQFLATLGHL